MVRLLGSRGASAVMGLFMLVLVSSEAPAQTVAALDIKAAVRAEMAGPATRSMAVSTVSSTSVPATAAVVATSTAVASGFGAVVQAQLARSVALSLAPAIAREAAWLFRGGWPLYALVDRYSTGAALDEQATCLATAVYFEARGETFEGQLAVARVVMNRAASGKYPPSWCATVKQPRQFSFVRGGRFPAINVNSPAWRKAQAITRLAISNAVPSLSNDVLWYHADYVAPPWGRRLSKVSKIGTHIFYRT